MIRNENSGNILRLIFAIVFLLPVTLNARAVKNKGFMSDATVVMGNDQKITIETNNLQPVAVTQSFDVVFLDVEGKRLTACHFQKKLEPAALRAVFPLECKLPEKYTSFAIRKFSEKVEGKDVHREKKETPVSSNYPKLEGYWLLSDYKKNLYWLPCMHLFSQATGTNSATDTTVLYLSYGESKDSKCLIPAGTGKDGLASVIDTVEISENKFIIIKNASNEKITMIWRQADSNTLEITLNNVSWIFKRGKGKQP